MTQDEIKEGLARALYNQMRAGTSHLKGISYDEATDWVRSNMRERAQAAMDFFAANGLVVVPVEPTDAMVQVGNYMGHDRMCAPKAVYKAMVQSTIQAAQTTEKPDG